MNSASDGRRPSSRPKEKEMPLIVYSLALEAVRSAHPLIERIRRHDRNLSDQAKRAGTSVVLNIAEAEYSDAGNRRARFHTAAGSTNELSAALELSTAYQYLPPAPVAPVLAQLDRVRGMLWSLSRR
jgi:four helix bundle protein